MHQKPLPGPLSAGVLAERVNSSSPPLSPQVCWRSAKVQLNSGILERRRQNLPAALSHFQLASAIEPGYCEPGYWIGITLVNMGESSERGGGREGGREGVLCFRQTMRLSSGFLTCSYNTMFCLTLGPNCMLHTFRPNQGGAGGAGARSGLQVRCR